MRANSTSYPYVTGYSSNLSDVTPVDATFSITWNEPVVAGAGTIVLRGYSNDVLLEIDVSSSQVTFSGNTMTINPSANLAYGTDYRIVVKSGIVQSSLDVTYPGSDERTFTTQLSPVAVNLTGTPGNDRLRGSELNDADVTNELVKSAEFKTLYGASPANADLVARLYHNILHRDAEPAGQQFWTAVLDRKGATVSELLASFSESAENQSAVATLIGQGISYLPFALS